MNAIIGMSGLLARHAARRRAARLRRDDPDVAATRCSRSSTTSSTSRRSRPAGSISTAEPFALAAGASRAPSTSSPRPRRGKGIELVYAIDDDLPAAFAGRPRPAPPDRPQPTVERGQVHRHGRGRPGRHRRPASALGRVGRSGSTSATQASGSRGRDGRGCSSASARPTRRSRRRFGGTGLGLAISRRLAELDGRLADGGEQRARRARAARST